MKIENPERGRKLVTYHLPSEVTLFEDRKPREGTETWGLRPPIPLYLKIENPERGRIKKEIL